MTDLTKPDELVSMTRGYVASIRAHLKAKALEGDADVIIERSLAAGSAIIAGLLMLIPATRGKAIWISGLLAVAGRFFNRRAARVVEHAAGE